MLAAGPGLWCAFKLWASRKGLVPSFGGTGGKCWRSHFYFLSFIKCCLMFKYLTMNIKEQHIQPLFISYKCAYTGDKHSKLFY